MKKLVFIGTHPLSGAAATRLAKHLKAIRPGTICLAISEERAQAFSKDPLVTRYISAHQELSDFAKVAYEAEAAQNYQKSNPEARIYHIATEDIEGNLDSVLYHSIICAVPRSRMGAVIAKNSFLKDALKEVDDYLEREIRVHYNAAEESIVVVGRARHLCVDYKNNLAERLHALTPRFVAIETRKK
jgi:hypothetical protein